MFCKSVKFQDIQDKGNFNPGNLQDISDQETFVGVPDGEGRSWGGTRTGGTAGTKLSPGRSGRR